MPSTSRNTVYSLLIVIFVLLIGMMAILGVAAQRHQRLEDQATDLQRSFAQQEKQIEQLRGRLENCDTPRGATSTDTSWNTPLPTR